MVNMHVNDKRAISTDATNCPFVNMVLSTTLYSGVL